jgi:aryl carrier-like protein
MKDAVALAWMGRLLDGRIHQPIIASVDWQVLAPVYEAKRRRLWLEYLRDLGAENGPVAEQVHASASLIDTIDGLERAIRQEAARVLGFRRGSLPDRQTPLADLGLDSLMAVTLRNRLQRLTGHSLPSTFAFEHPTPAQMASALDLLMWGSRDASGTPNRTHLELESDPLHPLQKDEERDEIRI